MLNKNKIATLVRTQSKMPMPSVLAKKVLTSKSAPPAGEKIPAAAAAKPNPGPALNFDEMTPQEIAAAVEEAAQAAEQQTDPEIEDLLVDYASGDINAPPEWAKNPDLWQKAQEAVGIGGSAEDRYDEPYAVVAYLYKALGGMAPSEAEHEAMESPEHEAEESPEEEAAEHGNPSGAAKKEVAAKLTGGVGNPALGQPPVHGEAGEGEAPGGELKQMLDAAAQQAQMNPDPELAEKLAGYDPERDGNPPEWAADPDKWAKAEAAVMPNWNDYDEPYAVVAHVYKNMGGKVK